MSEGTSSGKVAIVMRADLASTETGCGTNGAERNDGTLGMTVVTQTAVQQQNGFVADKLSTSLPTGTITDGLSIQTTV